jgi:TRAP-type C4-dicarboxylate transport system permease small subunit
MKNLLTLGHGIARLGLWLGGGIILASAILIAVDVLLRRFAGWTIGGADELAQFALAIGTTWSLAGALLERAHIRVDSAYGRFPLALRSGLDVLGLVLFLGFFSVVTWYAFDVFQQSLASGSRTHSALQLPAAVPQAIWVAGLVMFLFVGLLLLIEAISNLLKGDLYAVAQAIGTKSAAEEVNEELQFIADGAVAQVRAP